MNKEIIAYIITVNIERILNLILFFFFINGLFTVSAGEYIEIIINENNFTNHISTYVVKEI